MEQTYDDTFPNTLPAASNLRRGLGDNTERKDYHTPLVKAAWLDVHLKCLCANAHSLGTIKESYQSMQL